MLTALLSLFTPRSVALDATPSTLLQQEGACCRICYESATSPSNALFQPCMCRGSIGYVHTKCLNVWRRKAASPTAHSHCTNCKFAYKIQSSNPLFFFLSTKYLTQITVSTIVLTLAALNALLLPNQVSRYMLGVVHWNFTFGFIRHLAFGMSCFTVCGFLTIVRSILTDCSSEGRRPALLYLVFATICILCSENIAPPMVLFAIVEGIAPAGEAIWDLATRCMESEVVLSIKE